MAQQHVRHIAWFQATLRQCGDQHLAMPKCADINQRNTVLMADKRNRAPPKRAMAHGFSGETCHHDFDLIAVNL